MCLFNNRHDNMQSFNHSANIFTKKSIIFAMLQLVDFQDKMAPIISHNTKEMASNFFVSLRVIIYCFQGQYYSLIAERNK